MVVQAPDAVERADSGIAVVDADCHILEPPRALHELIDPQFRARAPRIVEVEGVEYWEGDPFFQTGPLDTPQPASGVVGMAGVRRWADQSSYTGTNLKYTDANPAGFFPEARLEEFAAEGIAQGVFFPTVLLRVESDLEYGQALYRAYNDWLSEFCRFSPDRLFGACATHLGDPAEAAKEVRRCATELGMRVAFVRPSLYIDGTQWWDDVYEPFWQACEENDVAVAFHPFTKDALAGSGRHFGLWNNPDPPALFVNVPFGPPVDAMFTLSSLICGGVLERHPGLRIGFVECSGGWAVPLLDRLDQRYEFLGQTMGKYFSMTPSEYFTRQCLISFDPDEPSLAFSAEQLGADRIMVGSDFPHPDAFYPDMLGMVDKQISGLSTDERRCILGESARAFYALPAVPAAASNG
jgi:predicted TIM-barrel fold metal-dependent hydrolase